MKKNLKFRNIIVLFIIGYVCYVFIGQQITMHNINNQINAKSAEKQKAVELNQKLQDEVKLSRSDAFIEKLARERLGLVKQGETPVINNK